MSGRNWRVAGLLTRSWPYIFFFIVRRDLSHALNACLMRVVFIYFSYLIRVAQCSLWRKYQIQFQSCQIQSEHFNLWTQCSLYNFQFVITFQKILQSSGQCAILNEYQGTGFESSNEHIFYKKIRSKLRYFISLTVD